MTSIDRDETRRRAQGAIDAERRAAIGPFTFNKARPVLAPREVIALLDALERAEDDAFRQRAAMIRERDRAVRAEAQSETRRQQTVYWQERAEGFEARIADVLALCDEWAAMGTRSMNIGAVRRALDAP